MKMTMTMIMLMMMCGRYVKVETSRTTHLLNVDVYKRRLEYIIEPFLLDANRCRH